jgi:hypothetical protein
MQHPILDHLNNLNNETDLLEQLHKEVLENRIDNARITAAKIEALKHLKFDLIKILKEDDNL